MRTRTNLIALAVTSIGLAAVFACGSTPKTEPGAATAMPSATAPAPTESAMPASSSAPDAATASADAGGGDAGDPKAAQCTALVNDANAELDAERIKVDKVCKKDSDCMAIKGHACGFVCTTGAIPKAEEKDWTAELTRMKEGPCKKWEEMECSKTAPPKKPTCINEGKKPACDKGHCTLK